MRCDTNQVPCPIPTLLMLQPLRWQDQLSGCSLCFLHCISAPSFEAHHISAYYRVGVIPVRSPHWSRLTSLPRRVSRFGKVAIFRHSTFSSGAQARCESKTPIACRPREWRTYSASCLRLHGNHKGEHAAARHIPYDQSNASSPIDIQSAISRPQVPLCLSRHFSQAILEVEGSILKNMEYAL